MLKSSKVVVIGAGLGGMSVALRLQGLGLDVTVLERADGPGGRASRLREAGFTWDTGPSLITMPWVLEQTFAAGGLDLHREVTLRRLDPLYRIRWAGEERSFDFSSSVDRLTEQVARFSGPRRTPREGLPRRAGADLRARDPRRRPAAGRRSAVVPRGCCR